MSALGQDLPLSFQDALRVSSQLLSRNLELVRNGVITTEAEQIVQAAYREATGRDLSRMDLYARATDRFPEAAGEKVIIYSGARSEGKLLQHLLGYQVFLDHEYLVGPEVLVPRPETESLVNYALRELGAQYGNAPRFGLEIGTGSGVISIELLARFSSLRIVASELSPRAQSKAEENASRILGEGARGAARFKIVAAQTAQEVWEPFERLSVSGAQFLVSNPPYLVAGTSETEEEVSAHEPHEALFAPKEDPLYFYRLIADSVSRFVEPGGLVFLEIPHERAAAITALFHTMGPHLVRDLAGRERVLVARV